MPGRVRVSGWSSPRIRRLRVRVSFCELPGLLIVTQVPQEQAELAGRGEGVGVVLAEDAAPPAQHLFLQFPGLRVVTQTRTGRWRVGWRR